MKRILESMRRAGVIGINHRNSRYTLRCNPRHLYPLVDDKLRTKRLCQEAGIPTPKLLAVATHQHAVQALPRALCGSPDGKVSYSPDSQAPRLPL